MNRRVWLARPRLDCSFKPGPVPETEGPPLDQVRSLFGACLDGLAAYHDAAGDAVVMDKRPLWRFELPEVQALAAQYDVVYFPHRQRSQFPIGDNAVYYKNAAFPEWLTLDKAGWGAAMSWLPVHPVMDARAWPLFRTLQERVAANQSLFEQPPVGDIGMTGYLLFVCQIPHDEAIQLHSDVSVEKALAAVLAYAERRGRHVVVKGHPMGRKSMGALRDMAHASTAAIWVEDQSIHACLADAERVLLVNSGVGFEAMLHDKTILRFGRAEYASVVPRLDCTVQALVEAESYSHRLEDYVGFLNAFLARCVHFNDPSSYGPAVEAALRS